MTDFQNTQNLNQNPNPNPQPGPKRLVRDESDKWIGGVCSGIGRYFGIEANVVRLLFALSILLPGPQFLLYLVLWFAMPRG